MNFDEKSTTELKQLSKLIITNVIINKSGKTFFVIKDAPLTKTKVSSALQSMKEEQYFEYVTLACEDGHQIEAHKLILTASSRLFSISLKKEKYPHTFIFM